MYFVQAMEGREHGLGPTRRKEPEFRLSALEASIAAERGAGRR